MREEGFPWQAEAPAIHCGAADGGPPTVPPAGHACLQLCLGPGVGAGSSGRGRAGQAAVGRGVTLSSWQHSGPSASSHHSLEVWLDILRGYSHGAVCCHLSHDPKMKRLPNTGPTWISEHRPGPCIPGPSRGQQCDPVRPVSDVIVHQAKAHGPRCPQAPAPTLTAVRWGSRRS